MFRNARKNDPEGQPKLNVELDTRNILLRLLLVVGAIVVAALAFAKGINGGLPRTQTGWQQIEPLNPETGISQEFLLCYNIGQTDQSAGEELKAVSSCYAEVLDHGYRVLSNEAIEGYVNLVTLNSQPNTAVTVDPLLYSAFQTLQASGSRAVYYGPLVEQYQDLFASTYDEEAASYDPGRSEDRKRFTREIAAFAADPEAVEVKLLPGNTLRLEVSPEYLAYAREKGVESFVDFGMLLNAFLCDAVADALEEQGYTNGYVTSFDGYARSLCGEEFGLNLFDWVEGKPSQLGTVVYDGPATLVSCRGFPVLEGDQVNYYTYSDGTVAGPYLNRAGELFAACPSLSTYSASLTTAQLAIRTLEAYAGEDSSFPSLEDLDWVSVSGGEIHSHGDAFRPVE